MDKKFQLVITGVGGQGILTVSDILGTAAIRDGLKAVMSEVHGMSQRGGIVISEMKIGDFSAPLIADHSADAILSFEPAEAYRILRKAGRGTYVVTNLRPLLPAGALMGREPYPDPALLIDNMRRAGLRAVGVPADDLAAEIGMRRAGNIVMLGALSAAEGFAVSLDSIRGVISDRFPKFADKNVEAFEKGRAFALERFSEFS